MDFPSFNLHQKQWVDKTNMEDLFSIKKKLENYKKIKQLTEAAKQGSISNYFLGTKKLLAIKNSLDYLKKTGELIIGKLNSLPNYENAFPQNNHPKKNLIVLIGATRELGAGIFSTLRKKLEKKISTEWADLLKKNALDFLIIGKGINRILKRESLKKHIVHAISDFNFSNAQAIANKAYDFIKTNKKNYHQVVVFNAQFKTFHSQSANIKTLIPLNENKDFCLSFRPNKDPLSKKHNASVIEKTIFEQPMEMYLEKFKEKFINTALFHEILTSLNAEHSARFSSMEKSSSNAEKYINETTLKMNKLRQVTITRQITELFSNIAQEE